MFIFLLERVRQNSWLPKQLTYSLNSGGREEVVANRTISLVLEWNQSSKDRRSVMIVQDDDMQMGKKLNVEPFLSVSKIETNIIFLNLHSVTNSDSENWNNK